MRILGAIGVVEMVDDIDVEKTQNQLIENGVWLRPYGKLLYTMRHLTLRMMNCRQSLMLLKLSFNQ
ncbi:Adenosylmethionine-8-amino-7-oxononanoate aminotransferase (EC [uncultured Gammaproteobacteria bacterium]|nr:Adenosylmethionine-8-amino-7-oxononanoate aminotransferase (EC [uncultured Gammaproteobacteria bacterium]